jgi:cytochrome P450
MLGSKVEEVREEERRTIALKMLQKNMTLDTIAEVTGLTIEQLQELQTQASIPEAENPWMKYAGIFKDDPQFDEMLEDIAAHRKALDADREELHHEPT